MLINKMINELNTSNLHYLSKYESTYYQASDIFLSGTPPNRSTAEQSVKFNYPGIGLLTKADPDGKIFVVGAIEGSPGHRAGVLRGDEIISVDGDPYDDVASFESKIGRSVSILLKRQIANDPFYATIIPDNI